MERETGSMSVEELRGQFFDIDFPEYQREPDIWSREQKQRLIDSILRQFDIASIYLYRRDDDELECIDGRQRLNAIMSFLGENPNDGRDNGFSLRIHNEISVSLENVYQELDGLTFEQLESSELPSAVEAVQQLLGYHIAVVYLSGVAEPDEFNLQFLRLNLGTLINAGEKLHAMVGVMRDLLFTSERIGLHPFFESVSIPTRRYAKEQTAAQVMLQVFVRNATGEFGRARHFDLQRFVKDHSEIPEDDPLVVEVALVLDALDDALGDLGDQLRNRAITVSLAILAWELSLHENEDLVGAFRSFVEAFLSRLRWQVANMKEFNIDDRYAYLVEFQRHLTQASVEKPAVTRRHELLVREFEQWSENGQLTGDAEYEAEEGTLPEP